MKIRGGYLPRITGRPTNEVQVLCVSETLHIPLMRGGLRYSPAVADGQVVAYGEPLGRAAYCGGMLALPAPAAGRVALLDAEAVRLTVNSAAVQAPRHGVPDPERVTAQAVRESLATGGLWPLFWSSGLGGMPALDGTDRPKTLLVNCVAAEPFRTRGKVILERSWPQIVKGLKFLPRLLADYGKIELVLTHLNDPVVRMIHTELSGYAWIGFQSVPVIYPVEDPRVLNRAFRRAAGSVKREDTVWVIDIQGVAAVGACLGEGTPLHERTLAVGGPGEPNPRHVVARVGTPVSDLVGAASDPKRTLVLRGGLMKGTPCDRATEAVGYDDDAFFVLPLGGVREFLSFVRPGFDRTSILPVFGSSLTHSPDRHITSSLRGERRPCVSCGLCEQVCPAGLMPQVLHRYLYADSLEEAEVAGIDLCLGCGLCTYVCPSKIELGSQFAEAQAKLLQDRREAAEALRQQGKREADEQAASDRGEEWLK